MATIPSNRSQRLLINSFISIVSDIFIDNFFDKIIRQIIVSRTLCLEEGFHIVDVTL